MDNIRTANNTHDAIEEITSNGFDLIILNPNFSWWNRGGITGTDLISNSYAANKKILLVSNKSFNTVIKQEFKSTMKEFDYIEQINENFSFKTFKSGFTTLNLKPFKTYEEIFDGIHKEILSEKKSIFYNSSLSVV